MTKKEKIIATVSIMIDMVFIIVLVSYAGWAYGIAAGIAYNGVSYQLLRIRSVIGLNDKLQEEIKQLKKNYEQHLH